MASRRPIPGVKHIVAVASGKGGVGKSTTAVNLALALAAHKLKVGLVDADVYGPSIPLLMNLQDVGSPEVDHEMKMVPMENYGIKCMSMGFLVPQNQAMIWRGPMVMSAVDQLFNKTAWGDTDVLVIDLPPGTGDAQLTISQQVAVSGAVIVSTPQDIALLDAVRGAAMFNKVDVPILGLIENMSYFICPSCKHVSHVFGHAGARRTAANLGLEFLGEVPLHIDIRATSDRGHPIVVADPDGPLGQIYLLIAQRVIEKLNDPASLASRAGPNIIIE